MDNRQGCCSGTGCIIGLLVALVALGYLVYTYHPLQVVSESPETSQAVRRMQDEQVNVGGGVRTHRIHATP